MKTTFFGGYILLPLFTFLGLYAFTQGANTQAGATSVPIGIPFNASGSTTSATNDFDAIGTTFDDGPDWYYYYCATSNAPLWVTITFTPGGLANPVMPSISVLDGTGAILLGQTQVFGDVSGTYGIPFTPIAGECYYFVVDNDGVTGPPGFNYTIQISNSVPVYPVAPTQPACTNIGFDSGSTAGWLGSWGHSMQTGIFPQPTPTYTPIFYNTTNGHHTITTPGMDLQAPIQTVCPQIPGNTNSLLVGDGPSGAYGGANIEQKFQVTASNALFTYYYALVIQDGGASGATAHTDQEQPYFKIDALDCAGNPIACGNLLVTGGPGIPGFTQIGTTGTYWKDWTPVMLDLTPYIGSCVTMRFTVGDCSIGAHYAYAYLDATCGPMSIVAPPNICQFQTTTLTAPTGAATYSWVETSAPGTVIGTTNTLSITPTTTGTFNYQCTMTSVTGCNSVLTSSVTVLPSPQITVTNPPAVCSPATVDLTNASVVTINSGSGTIDYFSDPACTVPLATPNAITNSGTYYIRILNANGCFEVEPVTVVINTTPATNVITANQAICPGGSVNLTSTVTPVSSTTPMTFTNTTDFLVPDGVSQVSSPITVSGVNQQTPGVLPIVSVCMNITHTWDEDLQIFLQCPDGTLLNLSTGNGLDGDNYTNTCFTPTGPSILTGTAPFNGNFTPEQAFTALNACSVNGTWNLIVSDNFAGDFGTLLDWSITFNSFSPGATFAWSPTTNMTNSTTLSPTVTPTATTTYTLTGTSGVGGCTSTDQVTITVNPLPTATISGTTTVCQNAPAPTITFTGANGTAPYTFTYNINGGANQTVSSGSGTTATLTAPTGTSGTFTYNLVSVTSALGCSQNQSGSAIVTVNPLPTATISGTTTVCQNAAAPTITFTGANGTDPYTFTYTINGGANQTVSSGAGTTATITAPTGTTGTFTYNLVSVTSALGCSQNQVGSTTITINPLPTATIAGTATVCQNTTGPTITFTGANGTAPYTFTYTINGGANQTVSSGAGSSATVTAPTGTTGTFTYNLVSVTSANACSQNQTGSAIVTINPLPTATISGTATVCQNATAPTITLTGANGTAPYTFTYSINGGANQTVSSGAGTTATLTAPTGTSGTFTYNLVSVTSALGCSQNQSGSAIVTVNPLPTATIAGTTTVCQNAAAPTITFTGANGTAPYTFTYTINGGSNQTVSSGAGSSATVAAPTGTTGTFTYNLVSVLSATTCSQNQTGSATITVNPTPTIGGVFTVCAGSTTQLTGTGTPAVTTPWTSSNTAVATVSSTGLVTGVNPGTSTITYTNSDGCSTTQAVTITSGATITGTVSICIGSTTQLSGTGTANATNPWVSSNTGVATVSNTGLVTSLSVGTTTITYTNSSGCLDNEVITVNALPTVTGSDVCIGGTTQLTGSGTANATNPWVSSNTAVATVNSTGLVTGVSVGSTIITYTNSDGCSNTLNLNVVGNPALTGTMSACVGATTQLSATGTPNATNPWTSSNIAVATVSASGLVTGISAGTTTITFTNSSSCQSTAVVTINPLPTITGTLSVCVGLTTQLTGSPTANATNPWTSSNTAVATVSGTGLVTGVSAGTSTITYTNSNGCSETALVTVNALPTAAIAGTSTVCAGSSTTFTISGTPNATVIYSNGTTNSNVVLNATGNATVSTGVLNTTTTYTLVSAQSAAPASCSNALTGSITITVNPIPLMSPVTNIAVCPGDNVSIPSFNSNPTGSTYTWTNTNTTIGLGASGAGDIPTFVAINTGNTPVSGTITVVPTLNGCSGSSVSFTIGVSNNPIANAGSDLNTCINSLTGNQIGSASVAGNTYSWSPTTGLSDPTISNPTVSTGTAGTTLYTVTTMNALGCLSTDEVSVTINPLPVVSFTSPVASGCAPVSISFTNTSPSSVNCVWTFEGGGTQVGCGTITQQFNTAGSYGVTLTITDANGCVNSLTNPGMATIYPEVNASFGVNVYEQSILNPVFNFNNTSTNATFYTWEFGDGTTSTQTSPTHTYAETPGVYHIILYASNAAGCNDSAVAVVSVVDELIFYVPNAFTPDGDEHNNVFFPVFSSGFDGQNYTLLIFDRWGEVIFESHNVDFGWDGTYIGQLCKEGVYTWKITIKERNKDKYHEYVGHVNLLK